MLGFSTLLQTGQPIFHGFSFMGGLQDGSKIAPSADALKCPVLWPPSAQVHGTRCFHLSPPFSGTDLGLHSMIMIAMIMRTKEDGGRGHFWNLREVETWS